MTMRRVLAVAFGVVTLSVAGMAAPADAASGNCVGGPGCATSLQAAVDAAKPGATIRIAAGTYAGGVRISKSLNLIGSGATKTVIRGGGPVLRIDTTSATPPTVVISGLTVTGGVWHGEDPVNAFGAGILIPFGPNQGAGATVTLREVVVSDNRTEPTAVSPSPSGAKCPDGDCPYAGSRGGGIAAFGSTLTIEKSVVTRNATVGRASDAGGGGIYTKGGSLTVRSSAVTDNTGAPREIGRYAEAGGIWTVGTATTILDSVVSGNNSVLVTSWPSKPQGKLLEMLAMGGGVHIAGGGSAAVQDTKIVGNNLVADDPFGEPVAFGAGFLVDDGSTLVMQRTTISKNRIDVRAATTEDAGPSGTAAEFDSSGEVTDVQVTDNTTTVTSIDGRAAASAALATYAGNPQHVVLTRVLVKDNSAVARSRNGSAIAQGAGIINQGMLDLRDVTVKDNTAAADAPTATAQGGGIYNGLLIFDQQIELTMSNSTITGNVVVTSPGGTAQGGGIFSTAPLTITGTRIAGNRPDQCVGCAASG
jgi:hypothetical protein